MTKIEPRTDFILIHADWPAQRALDLIDSARQTPFIVVRERPTGTASTGYYAIRRRRARNAFEQKPDEPVAVALGRAPRDDLLQVVMGIHGLIGVIEMPRMQLGEERPGDVMRGGERAGDVLRGEEHRGGALRRGEHPSAGFLVTRDLTPLPLGPEALVRVDAVTREIAADVSPSVPLGGETSLLVWLSAKLGHPKAVPFALPVGANVDVVVRTAGGVACVGPSEGALRVSAPQSELPIQFKVRGAQLGPGTVTIFAFHAGVCVAKLTLEVEVVAAAAEMGAEKVQETATIGLAAAPSPDLSIFVFEGQSEVTFRLLSADGAIHMKEFGPTRLNDSVAYSRGFFRDIERLRMTTPEERANAWLRLTSKGTNLFDTLFPEDLRILLWDLKDRIRSVQITSEEPWIPWELCRLKGRVGDRIVEGGFFAEVFAMSRWFYGVPAPRDITLRNMAIVVPRDSGLRSAPDERSYLLSLDDRPRRSVTEIPANLVELHNEMAKGLYDAWHFTGHARGDQASDADQVFIELEGREPLRPDDVSGNAENVLVPRPFVFLNACQSAQAGISLTGPGGWAKRFLRADKHGPSAAAFLGTYWAVDDRSAFAFAQALYKGIFDGQSIAEATRAARQAIRKDAHPDPTWLAYTLYAHPNARLTKSGDGR
jgi:hypothetical protein